MQDRIDAPIGIRGALAAGLFDTGTAAADRLDADDPPQLGCGGTWKAGSLRRRRTAALRSRFGKSTMRFCSPGGCLVMAGAASVGTSPASIASRSLGVQVCTTTSSDRYTRELATARGPTAEGTNIFFGASNTFSKREPPFRLRRPFNCSSSAM